MSFQPLDPFDSGLKLKFKDEQTFIPCEISEKLLVKLSEKRKLDDLVMTLFSSDVTRLKHITLKVILFYKRGGGKCKYLANGTSNRISL